MMPSWNQVVGSSRIGRGSEGSRLEVRWSVSRLALPPCGTAPNHETQSSLGGSGTGERRHGRVGGMGSADAARSGAKAGEGVLRDRGHSWQAMGRRRDDGSARGPGKAFQNHDAVLPRHRGTPARRDSGHLHGLDVLPQPVAVGNEHFRGAWERRELRFRSRDWVATELQLVQRSVQHDQSHLLHAPAHGPHERPPVLHDVPADPGRLDPFAHLRPERFRGAVRDFPHGSSHDEDDGLASGQFPWLADRRWL